MIELTNKSQYYLLCRGLFEKPTAGLSCFDRCKNNVGYKLGGRRCSTSPLHWKQAYHTSKLTGAQWVKELIYSTACWKVRLLKFPPLPASDLFPTKNSTNAVSLVRSKHLQQALQCVKEGVVWVKEQDGVHVLRL